MPGSERPLRQGQGLAASSLRSPGPPAEMRTPVPDPDSPHQTESPCLRLNPCPHPLLAGLLLLCMHTERMQMSSNIMINIFCSVSCIVEGVSTVILTSGTL